MYFVTFEVWLGWGARQLYGLGRIQLSGQSVKFLPSLPWLGHLRGWKSNEDSYSVLTLSDVFGAPHPLSKGTRVVKRAWGHAVTTSRDAGCANLKEKQQRSCNCTWGKEKRWFGDQNIGIRTVKQRNLPVLRKRRHFGVLQEYNLLLPHYCFS